MNVTALLMAGGRGARMRHILEKPLIPVHGRAMVERVLDAIQASKRVSRTIIAVSPNTPQTAQRMRRVGRVEVIETPGKGYHEDMKYAMRKMKLNTTVVVSADLPLITPEIIDQVVEEYEKSKKPALMVAVRREFCEQLGLHPNQAYPQEYGSITPAGINVLDGTKIDEGEVEESVLLLERVEIAANINSPEDLKKVEELAYQTELRRHSSNERRNKTHDEKERKNPNS